MDNYPLYIICSLYTILLIHYNPNPLAKFYDDDRLMSTSRTLLRTEGPLRELPGSSISGLSNAIHVIPQMLLHHFCNTFRPNNSALHVAAVSRTVSDHQERTADTVVCCDIRDHTKLQNV